ncbi:alpha/beta-hydrolase [Hyaloscypha variabilis]|uniref:Alpha/beta-hydrolase n=1 Tax=Hyaloscypha variabilis (strain UAMH 11265 / GT02V1 / F) TaxID=1149755 RepID=A0A2J6S3Z4_HYAVF|nr:alpha/beta-hydrolase [Hyaloscypha variabilis F]
MYPQALSHRMFSLFLTAVFLFSGVIAAPVVLPRQSITVLSTAQISTYTPYTYFASAGYCNPTVTQTWTCGANCNANPGFKTVASGGDGDAVQYWFVGYYPATEEVIVSHQGTDPDEILPDLTDVDIVKVNLDSTHFPGVPSTVLVHQGFADAQLKAADSVLAAVETALSTYSATKVTLVGHSLGAAISLLDSVYLPLHLQSGITYKTITYGMPRVGNQAFANYVDADSPIHLTHIGNKEDPVPVLPPLSLGFVQASGEIHIQDSNAWDACPGQDNDSDLCSTGDVPTVFEWDVDDHDGPYNGVTMGC